MTRTADPGVASGRPSPALGEAAAEAVTIAEDRRLAALHLRVGSLSLAWAELEDLHRRDALDAAGLADLAEARWRAGDLDGAATAAAAHLAAGEARPIALVIAAEGAAAAGRLADAGAHIDALGGLDAETVDVMFAGMPRQGAWPSAAVAATGMSAISGDTPGSGRSTPTSPSARARPGGTGGGNAAGLRGQPADAARELDRARGELSSGAAADAARGVARLALVLRLDPALAPAVLDALQPRRDPAALLLRGDAYRLLGRHLEAEAALQAASQALGALDVSRSARPGEEPPPPRRHVTPQRTKEKP